MWRASILIALVSSAGCIPDVLCDVMLHDPSFTSSCKDYSIVDYRDLQEGPGQKAADSERAARERAAPACDRGEAHACLTVAVYDERHHGRRATIARAYAVACRGDLAFGCYGAGRFEADAAIALPILVRGCELGEAASCEAAATMDPGRETKFHEAACWLNDDDACNVAALSWLYDTGGPVGRRRARPLLVHSCNLGSARSCELLERIR